MSAASAGKVKAKRVAAFTASSTSHACCELCDAQTGTDENTPIANRRERHELVPRRERDRRGIVEVHSIRICHLCRRVVDNWFADELLAEHLSTKDSLKDALLDAGWFKCVSFCEFPLSGPPADVTCAASARAIQLRLPLS